MKSLLVVLVSALSMSHVTAQQIDIPLESAVPIQCHSKATQCVLDTTSANADANAAIADLVTKYFDWPGAQLDHDGLASLRSALEQIPASGGRDDLTRALILAQHGALQLVTNDPIKAAAPLREAVRLLSSSLPRDDPRLIAPYALLGMALTRTGKPREGVKMIGRAQNVTHLRWGTNNTQQIPLLYLKAEPLQDQRMYWKVDQLYRTAYRLSRSNFGNTSRESVLAAHKLGTWLRSVFAYKPALTVYRDALNELRGEDGVDPPEALPLLLGKAHAYLAGPLDSRSFGMVQRVVDVMAADPEVFDFEMRTRTHVLFGDLLMSRSREKDALEQYEMAWQLASEGGLDSWLQRLAQPELISSGILVPSPEQSNQPRFAFSYRINQDGRPLRIHVDATNSNAQVTNFARTAFRGARFRPPIIDGKATDLSDQVMSMDLMPYGRIEPIRLFDLEPRARPNLHQRLQRPRVTNWRIRPSKPPGGLKSITLP